MDVYHSWSEKTWNTTDNSARETNQYWVSTPTTIIKYLPHRAWSVCTWKKKEELWHLQNVATTTQQRSNYGHHSDKHLQSHEENTNCAPIHQGIGWEGRVSMLCNIQPSGACWWWQDSSTESKRNGLGLQWWIQELKRWGRNALKIVSHAYFLRDIPALVQHIFWCT